MTMAKSSENVQTNILVEAIREQIELARKFKMSYAAVVGVLEMVKHEVIDEAKGTLTVPSVDTPVAEPPYAFNVALALESIPDELQEVDHGHLIRFARIVAYKTFHNLHTGLPMQRDCDPILVDDQPAAEVWGDHYKA